MLTVEPIDPVGRAPPPVFLTGRLGEELSGERRGRVGRDGPPHEGARERREGKLPEAK